MSNLAATDHMEDFTALWPGIDMVEINQRAGLFHESDAMSSYGHINEGAMSLRALTAHYRFIDVVDGQFKHCLAAAEQGIEAVLFGDYKWSQAHVLPGLITWRKDWPQTREYFYERAS
jgi:hypothetical protein